MEVALFYVASRAAVVTLPRLFKRNTSDSRALLLTYFCFVRVKLVFDKLKTLTVSRLTED
jgi:hypothetical protein